MSDRNFNVLILCTANSARSIMAEALLNQLSALDDGAVTAYSAGSRPRGAVHPVALQVLSEHGIDTRALRSKSWDEFALSSAPAMDVVITVCDSAAGEACPLWPGVPARVHWGLPDPAAVVGSEAETLSAFRAAFDELSILMLRLIRAAEPGLGKDVIEARLQAVHSAAA